MLRFIPVLALLLFTACGLAENEQDDKNKRIYITFTDPAFEQFCLGMFDLDHDGRISRYEAQRVLVMDCSGRNISAMWEIGEFSRLRELDCSGNNLTRLDLRKCPDLQKLDCGDNEITSLDIDGLRGLAVLDCAGNLLARLDLKSNSSLRQLDCRGNLLVTLDLTPCSELPFPAPPRIVFRWLPASVSCWLSVSVSRRLPASFPAGSPHCSPLPPRVASRHLSVSVPRRLPALFPAGSPRRFPAGSPHCSPLAARVASRRLPRPFPAVPGVVFCLPQRVCGTLISDTLLKSRRRGLGISDNNSYLWVQKMSFAP